MYKLMFLFPVLGMLLVLGLLVYSKAGKRGGSDTELSTRDPLLRALQTLNPGLPIEDEFSRMQVYWINQPGTQRKILFPKSEAAGAKITLRSCDPSEVPHVLLYPSRTDLTCLEVDNDQHKLSAYYFRTKDRLKKVVGFFEAPLDPSRRFSTSHSPLEERREVLDLPGGVKQFQFSYFLFESVDTVGFVGYREELKSKLPKAEN